ncbi:MAG: hypothetical protein KU28_02045 [Sulfurovum sp. PC08-66]|jgi:hypothetical protein|nr:MAG: hypothetical protein KU28_02045 [Sulfurovum sp. PC08-66]
MRLNKAFIATFLAIVLSSSLYATTKDSVRVNSESIKEKNEKCVMCHMKENRSLVDHYENSAHAVSGVGCYSCHAASKDDSLGYEHEGAFIKTIQTPNDCKHCHEREVNEMTNSHHATAGEIMASLDNMLAEAIASFPDTKADAVNGCWQCHGSIIKPEKDKDGKIIYNEAGAPKMDWMTWPNSGVGRINHDGSKGSCNACHTRHDFSSSRARQPENCGKCHLGPDHPQKEIYEESKHGIAYYAAPKGDEKGGMNIRKQGKWVLGKDYNAAPTCSTCHMGSYKKSNGSVVKGTHNVGDRISWTLRPAISVKLNRVIFEDNTTQDIPGDKAPAVGSMQMYSNYIREDDKLKKVMVEKKVAKVISWEGRRDNMKEVCSSCHSTHHVDNFYEQFDSLVVSYNEKFAKPGEAIVAEMKKDGIWKKSGFQQEDIGYIWFEIWHHEGRRARHGAAMQAPDYTHWHGMYEVSRHFYSKFLPKVIGLAEKAGQGEKYKKLISDLLDKPEHEWYKTGGTPEMMKVIEDEKKERYKQ